MAGDDDRAADGGNDTEGGAGSGGSHNGEAGAPAPPGDDGGNGGGGKAGAPTSMGGVSDAEGGAGGEAGARPVEVSVIKHFNVGPSLCGLGFDSAVQRLWAQRCFGANMLSYSPEGVAGITIAAPGESADDVDIDFSPIAFTLAQQELPAQSALFFNGESAAHDIYAVDLSGETSTPLATLATAFGNSHVVGGAFHAQRGTFFAVQDKVPGAEVGNLVAEVDPLTSAILNDFSVQASFPIRE